MIKADKDILINTKEKDKRSNELKEISEDITKMQQKVLTFKNFKSDAQNNDANIENNAEMLFKD